jgi:RHH-type proline utilization regulon transcriptional repressor/proline dehydrogenase/delta 1-pyrroline-5-carboxylate dehydrogenase
MNPSFPAPAIEERTQMIGHEIFARVNRQGPMPFLPAWWDEMLMNFTMGQEALKVQLFRFVDALPLLQTPESISAHLKEYLGDGNERLPWYVRYGVQWLPSRGLGGRLLAKSARWNAERLARRFIAGSNVSEALKTIGQMRKRNLAFTVDLLGEATITEIEADAVLAQYMELIEGLSAEVNRWPHNDLIDGPKERPIPRVNVSVKLSALFSQFDPIDPVGTSRGVLKRLRPILRAAKLRKAFVNFDMEQHAFKDATLQIFRDVLMEDEFRTWPDVGIAIQVYLHDTEADLHRLIGWVQRRGTPVWVRLVKGAYWDYETVIAAQNDWPSPVFSEKWQSDANFEKLADLLLENHTLLRPAFGSHNIRSIAHAMATADMRKVPREHYEFQMLYGMADPIKEVLVSMGHRVRIYTPYGKLLPGMAYLVRRLLENTSNESFLRASFAEGIPEERLLQNPLLKKLEAGSLKREGVDSNSKLPASNFSNEPPTNLDLKPGQLAMQKALTDVKAQLGQKYPPIINHQPVQVDTWIDSLNPSQTKMLIGQWGKASVHHAESAIVAASKAFPAWRDTTVEERAEYLRRIAQIFRDRRFELSAWEILECGKPWREADADIAEAIDFCDYYAAEMLRLSNPQHRDIPGEDNQYFYEPRGVTVVIAPWNFPLAILCGMTTAALVAGNTVIMKPAEQSSVVAAKFMEVMMQAGLPQGVVNFLPGIGEEIGPTLVNHKDVAVIAFTGSLKVGLLINQQAAVTPANQDHVKKVIAEMGGKNGIIVDADADLDEAVKGTVASAFGYQGQKCSAGSRVIVLEPLYETFLNRLVEATRSLSVMPSEEPGCSIGPVIDAEARDRILKMIEIGRKESRLAYAADVGPLAQQGYFVGPHIFADVPETATIAQEEIFGPVLAVIKARDLEHALNIANGTRYALTGGFFSRSPRNIELVKRRFRVGNLYINRKITGALVDRQPFGGFKLSGIGSKAGGPDYLLQFLMPRSITENTLRRGFAPEVEG